MPSAAFFLSFAGVGVLQGTTLNSARNTPTVARITRIASLRHGKTERQGTKTDRVAFLSH